MNISEKRGVSREKERDEGKSIGAIESLLAKYLRREGEEEENHE